MATNADKSDKDQISEDTEETKEDDVEATADDASTEENEEEAETGDGDGQTDDQTDGDSQEEPTFTKGEGFDWVKGETPQEAWDNLKEAYNNSSREALKWKKEADEAKKKQETPVPDSSPLLRQAERREREAMDKEYDSFLKQFPQATEPDKAEKLEKRVLAISKSIQDTEEREPSFAEVLNLAANSFGWKPDTSGKVASAMKDNASSSTRTSPPKPPAKSKVTPAQIKAAKKFWPDKSDADIIKDLEPHAA